MQDMAQFRVLRTRYGTYLVTNMRDVPQWFERGLFRVLRSLSVP